MKGDCQVSAFMTVIDVETTGFGRAAEVQEIGCVSVDETFSVINYFHTLVRSCDAMEEAQAVHGISGAMTEDAPNWIDVRSFVMDHFILPSRMLGGCNVGFDLRMILPRDLSREVKDRHVANIKQSLSKECQRHLLPDEGQPHYALRGAIAAAACLKESYFHFLPGLGALPAMRSHIHWTQTSCELTAKPRAIHGLGANEVLRQYRMSFSE